MVSERLEELADYCIVGLGLENCKKDALMKAEMARKFPRLPWTHGSLTVIAF